MNHLSNFLELSALYQGPTDETSMIIEYQETEDPTILSIFYVRLHSVAFKLANQFFYITEEDKQSFIVEELHKTLQAFDTSMNCKLSTAFYSFLKNRLRSETKLLAYQKRRVNNVACEIPEGLSTDQDFSRVEVMQSIAQANILTTNELRYCSIILSDNYAVIDSDVAAILNISPSAIHQLKKSICRKFMNARLFVC
jgi:hypothetical protein